jgi:hypothetical protein
MGQYLAIGLVTQMSVKKTDVQKTKLSIEELFTKMAPEFHFLPDIYEISEKETMYYFSLKDEIFNNQLISFLEKFYPLVYFSPDDYSEVIEFLKTNPQSEWIKWAESRPAEGFQLDDYGIPFYLSVKSSTIPVFYEAIILSMEGKISMEEYGRQFLFFKYCIAQTFKELPIAGALQIYITG